MAQDILVFVKAIRNRLAQADQTRAIIDLVTELRLYLDENPAYKRSCNELLMLSSRLNQVNYQENNDLLPPNELNRIKNQCTQSFIAILDDIKFTIAPLSSSKTKTPSFMENKKIKVFLSYSHRDEVLKEELDRQLSVLKRSAKIATWNDRLILAGDLWGDKIKQALQEADLVLFLISADFLSSDYIWDNELLPAIERHKQGQTRVVPLFMRPCYWKNMPFAPFQGFPKDAKAVTSFTNKDEAYTEIVSGLVDVVDELLGIG